MNPFKVLNVTKQATNKEIIQAVGLQMRSRQYPARTIARAQKMLLDPDTRACQSFLHHMDLTDATAVLLQDLADISGQIEQQYVSENMPLHCLTVFEPSK